MGGVFIHGDEVADECEKVDDDQNRHYSFQIIPQPSQGKFIVGFCLFRGDEAGGG